MQKTPQRTKQQVSQGFGERLAGLRRAAGYTQEELAAASGVSRRMIVYYESQERQRLADVLAKLAPPLAATADEMLGLAPPKKSASSVLDARVARRLRGIEHLVSADKRQLLQLIDAFVDHARRKRRG
jgi:transcriptional regulator with XRE-family HTH domain